VVFGGSAPKRAARLGDAYLPPVPDQALADTYAPNAAVSGRVTGSCYGRTDRCGSSSPMTPKRSWAQIGPHAVHETNGYGALSVHDPGANPWREVTSVDEVRRAGLYAVVTPSSGVTLARSLDPRAGLKLKPLVGRSGPRRRGPSLDLFVDKVLPDWLRRGRQRRNDRGSAVVTAVRPPPSRTAVATSSSR